MINLPSRARDRNTRSLRLRLDAFLPYRLSMLTTKVQAHLARHYRQVLGLTLHETRIVAVLGNHRPVSSNAIVQHTTMDKATVSRAVARLLRRGLLTRRPDPDDRRLLVLDLTTRGAGVYRDLAVLAHQWEAWLTEAMPRTARARLVRDLALLSQRLDTAPQPDFSAASRRGR